MNRISGLFSSLPGASKLRQLVKEVEHDQRKKQRDLAMLEATKSEKVRQAVEAKKAGKQALLRDIYRDVSQTEIDIASANSDLRRLWLTKTALSSFARKMETFDAKRDRKGLEALVRRIQTSSMQKAIDDAQVDDESFHALLQDILGEEEDLAAGREERPDAGFAEFDRAIGALAKSEAVDAGGQAVTAAGASPVPLSTDQEQELAFLDSRIAELLAKMAELERQITGNQQQASQLQNEAASQRSEAADAHSKAQELMANPDTQTQGQDLEAHARALEEKARELDAKAGDLAREMDSLRRMFESVSNMLKSYEDQRRALIRNMG